MTQTRYSPRKEILLFLLVWPVLAILLCILTMSIPYFYHFIEKLIELLRSDTTTGLGAFIQYILVLPCYALAETLLWSIFKEDSDNFVSNPLVQYSEYYLMLGWTIALVVFYTRYYKNCSKKQLKKMKHPTLFYFTPIIVIVACALFAGIFF